MPRAVALKRLHVKGLGSGIVVVRMGGVEVQQRTVQQGVKKRLELALKRKNLIRRGKSDTLKLQ